MSTVTPAETIKEQARRRRPNARAIAIVTAAMKERVTVLDEAARLGRVDDIPIHTSRLLELVDEIERASAKVEE